MWGKWVFPTSQDPLHHPLNYGCRLFPCQKKALWTWKIFLHFSSVDVIAVFRKFHKSVVEPETPHLTEFDRR